MGVYSEFMGENELKTGEITRLTVERYENLLDLTAGDQNAAKMRDPVHKNNVLTERYFCEGLYGTSLKKIGAVRDSQSLIFEHRVGQKFKLTVVVGTT